MTNEKLIRLAKGALEMAYTPYSSFRVGAAVLGENNKVYLGANIENSSFGATNCAERTAIFQMIMDGERKVKKIAVVSEKKEETFPCGICLQVLSEFMAEDGEVILENKDTIIAYRFRDFLPYAFVFKKGDE